MNTLNPLGSSLPLPQRTVPLAGAEAQFHPVQKTQPSLGQSAHDLVSLSTAGLDLAQQDDVLAQRVNNLSSATADLAQHFLTDFAKTVLGDAAKGMELSFDSVSVAAQSSFSGIVQHSADANGSSDAAAFSLEDASSFVGKGHITTADGHRYSFEVEVHFQSKIESAVTTTSRRSSAADAPAEHDNPANPDRAATPPHAQDLAAHFPGTIADLFSMLDHGVLHLPFELHAKDNPEASPQAGNLKLRLLDLLESPPPRAAQLAKTYGDTAAPGQVDAQA